MRREKSAEPSLIDKARHHQRRDSRRHGELHTRTHAHRDREEIAGNVLAG